MPSPWGDSAIDDAVLGNSQTAQVVSQSNVIQGHALTDEASPRPVQNARIVAKKVGADDEEQAHTDASGAYTLTLPDGISGWRVRAETTDTTVPADALAPSGEQLVSFGREPETKTVDFTFGMPDAQIVGSVLITGTEPIVPTFPVTVTAVQLFRAQDAASMQGTHASDLVRVSEQINPDGTFTLTVPAGVYGVGVWPEDPLTYLPPAPVNAQVSQGDTKDLGTLYLTPLGNAATLSGQVLTPDDNGVVGLQVVAYNLDQIARLPTRSTTTQSPDGNFMLSVNKGTWWVVVTLGEGDDYMPYRLQWQTIVTVESGDAASGIVLRVVPASFHIVGTLVEEESGDPATDACGLVVAFKGGKPTVYDYRRFSGDTFDLPVVSGTFRLVVVPNPGIEELGSFAPSGCEPGKYLAKTVRTVSVGEGVTTAITVPLRVTNATIHGEFRDEDQQAVTGWDGQMLGWSQGSWSAARIDPVTGVGDLRASDDTWWLAYHIDEESPYQERPGVVRAEVPTGAIEMTVTLRVATSAALITGTVYDPNGDPLPWVAVSAFNFGSPTTGGDRAITGETGQFTLTLDYGTYLVTAFGPPEWREEQPWISPEPQRVRLRSDQANQTMDLHFRRGDATIHGQVALATIIAAQGVTSRVPALVWAATKGGHTKTWTSLDEEYSLPALQGQTWMVGAVYETGSSLWITHTRVTVDSADVPLDLALVGPYTTSTSLMRSVDPDRPFYGELVDRISVYIPAGALPTRETSALVGPVAITGPIRRIVNAVETLQLLIMFYPGIDTYAEAICFMYGICPGEIAAMSNSTPSSDIVFLSPAYQVTAEDATGVPVVGDLNVPAVLQIPYDEEQVTGLGFTESDIQPIYYNDVSGGWEPVDSFVVDTDADEVVVFADRLGTYALIATQARSTVFLPLVLRDFSP